MNNGREVHEFEQVFAAHVGARYAIALCNGTATLHTALVALGVKPDDKVAVPPLTMASTTIAVLHAGAVPVFCDVDPDTWLMKNDVAAVNAFVPVDLYGLQNLSIDGPVVVHDAAQTLRHHHTVAFTSYSFQASKIMALSEGGMLVTDDEDLAERAREFSSLGYSMQPDHPCIYPAALKHPTYERHYTLGWNYRMSDHVARAGNYELLRVPALLDDRRAAAAFYDQAIGNTSWIKRQHVPAGWTHDYWTYAVALESADLWDPFTDAVTRYGGEMPYGAWRITYQEPAFRHLAEDGTCPVAEDLQPRLVQFQTNDVDQAVKNADAVAGAIKEIGG